MEPAVKSARSNFQYMFRLFSLRQTPLCLKGPILLPGFIVIRFKPGCFLQANIKSSSMPLWGLCRILL